MIGTVQRGASFCVGCAPPSSRFLSSALAPKGLQREKIVPRIKSKQQAAPGSTFEELLLGQPPPATASPSGKGSRKELRVKERLFPGVISFDPKTAGFSPFPSVLRHAMFLFSPRAWQILSYIMMKAGPQGVAWFPLGELQFDLGFASKAKLRTYLTELADHGWVRWEQSRGKDYFALPDPHQVLKELATKGLVSREHLETINELLEAFEREAITVEDPTPLS